MERISNVTIRDTQEIKTIKIGSDLKPEIIDSVIQKWQFLIDTLAKIIHVPSGLIMRLNENTIEVFLAAELQAIHIRLVKRLNLFTDFIARLLLGLKNC